MWLVHPGFIGIPAFLRRADLRGSDRDLSFGIADRHDADEPLPVSWSLLLQRPVRITRPQHPYIQFLVTDPRSTRNTPMLHDATNFYQSWPGSMNLAKAKGPDIGKAFGPFFQGLMEEGGEGGLSVKHKELIALGIGMAVRSVKPAIFVHVEKCLKAGATPKEVMDAAGVAVMMVAGPYTPTRPSSPVRLSTSKSTGWRRTTGNQNQHADQIA